MTYEVEWALTASYLLTSFLFNAKSRFHVKTQMRVCIPSVLFEFHLLYFKVRACIFNQFQFNFIVKKIIIMWCCQINVTTVAIVHYYSFSIFTFYSPKPCSMKKTQLDFSAVVLTYSFFYSLFYFIRNPNLYTA